MYVVIPNARSLLILESYSSMIWRLEKQPTTRMGISWIQNSTLSHACNIISPSPVCPSFSKQVSQYVLILTRIRLLHDRYVGILISDRIEQRHEIRST